MFETSYIELHKEQYQKNLEFIKKAFLPDSELCSVLKGNAYGHGDIQMIQMAQDLNVKVFAVFNAFEALRVFPHVRTGTRLIILGDLTYSQIPWAIENKVEFYVYDLALLEKTISIAARMKQKAKIHLELETGMHRLGIEPFQVKTAIQLIKDHQKNLKIMGICTHFAGAESIGNFVRIKQQSRNFENALKTFREHEIKPKQIHAACSAAAIRFKKSRYDMGRIGILQYGYWPSKETFIDYAVTKKVDSDPLQGIISWKSRVMTLKNVKAGKYIGYGSSHLTERDERFAVIPVGYSNGFSRNLSNQGRVLIRGTRVSVAGIVNMNAIMVDVTNVPGVEVGDEVVLIGEQEGQRISVSSFSDYSNQLNYEMLTRLPIEIPRLIKP